MKCTKMSSSSRRPKSGPDYSKIATVSGAIAQHPSQKGKLTLKPASSDSVTATKAVSSQMDAVMRLMSGQGERTVAQKLADTNRPTWEQYKKDNEDKLDISGQDRKQMEAYRKELDADREKRLKRGLNHGAKEYDSEDESSTERKRSSKKHKKKKDRKKHRKKDRKHKRRKRYGDPSSSDYSSDDEGSGERNHRKKSSRRNKKHKSTKNDGDDDKYRLSSFFTKGSESD